MGRKLNHSTPTVIQTELAPLDEHFSIVPDDTLEQWYYDNTTQYKPNRKLTPLTLTPTITVFDVDTEMTHTPTINNAWWYVKEWDNTQQKYVETEITAEQDSDVVDYYKSSNNTLTVKKNVAYSHPVTIRCRIEYIDPRDSGIYYYTGGEETLITNRDATIIYPEVNIVSASSRAYNPIVDDTKSTYEFKGEIVNNVEPATNDCINKYKIDLLGTEEVLPSDSGCAPIMDIRYGSETTSSDQEFKYRQVANGTLSSIEDNVAYIEKIKGNTVAWNQLVQNGDFSEGNNLWSGANAIYSTTDNILSFTAVQSNGNVYTSVDCITGHKYIYSFLYKGTSETINSLRVLYNMNEWLGEKFFSLSTSWNVGTNIFTCTSISNKTLQFRDSRNSGWDTIYLRNVQMFDLTLIYGSGNEPTTVEEFEADYQKWFGKPLTYEAYDAGSLRSVLMTGMKSVGFNQWDEEWELGSFNINTGEEVANSLRIRTKNYIRILPNKQYYFQVPSANWANNDTVVIRFYDSNKNYIGHSPLGGNDVYPRAIFTTPINASYLKFATSESYGSTYNNDICINISDASKNGTYEPYWTKTAKVPVTSIQGRKVENGVVSSTKVTIFPDGMKKADYAGTIRDLIYVDNSMVIHASKNVNSKTITGAAGDTITLEGCDTTTTEFLCGKSIGTLSNGTLTLTAEASNVVVYYPLAESQDYVLDAIEDYKFIWYGIDNQTEVLADTLPWYVSGQETDTLTVNALYGEDITVVLRAKIDNANDTLSPSKSYASIQWKVPDLDTTVVCSKGSAVRSNTDSMEFGTIINDKTIGLVSDELKDKHLRFHWKYRKNTTSVESDAGWGKNITIDGSTLRSVRSADSRLTSTLVYPYVYVMGAYEEITDNGEAITDGGEAVYDRSVE